MRREAALKRVLGVVAAGLALAATGCSNEHSGAAVATARVEPSAAAFLESHWRSPVKATGSSAGNPHPSLDDLRPSACGSCHQAQHDDWRASLHSRAMGPGVAGQFKGMDDAERRDCRRCHAPLDEQGDAKSALSAEGLFCAGCHVREGKVFGPPRRDGSTLASAADLPHGGWKANDAFEQSLFCAPCHQFEANGYALNGKLLENTYSEWNASRHAREGRACQACHMPGRRHLWRGIHDPQMTRAGITIDPLAPRLESGGRVVGSWRITNSGTGHFFPTYVTPRIIATIRQETAAGKVLEGTAMQYVIAREITPDLTIEVSDSRIAPDGTRELRYAKRRQPAATHLALEIRVEPDAFYTDLYRSLLKPGAPESDRGLIAKALAQSIASQYVLYADRQAVP